MKKRKSIQCTCHHARRVCLFCLSVCLLPSLALLCSAQTTGNNKLKAALNLCGEERKNHTTTTTMSPPPLFSRLPHPLNGAHTQTLSEAKKGRLSLLLEAFKIAQVKQSDRRKKESQKKRKIIVVVGH